MGTNFRFCVEAAIPSRVGSLGRGGVYETAWHNLYYEIKCIICYSKQAEWLAIWLICKQQAMNPKTSSLRGILLAMLFMMKAIILQMQS